MSEPATQQLMDSSFGKTVLLVLKGGKTIRGLLKNYDIYLNVVLENAEEVSQDGKSRDLGTIVVRGDNIVIVSPVAQG
ncbi:MAG TPA: RNA-binding protein [Thermoprotei archaeon]|mgnify:CR=1 FL=1|nr:LSm family protein [TACK group archaeon]HEV51655.1 RNA-binding protein [Thermoprotei archaeon]